MKSDTDQLIYLLNNIRNCSLKRFGIHANFTRDIEKNLVLWSRCVKQLMTLCLGLPVGTVIKIEDANQALKNHAVFVLVGSPTLGNIPIYVDQVILELENQLHKRDRLCGVVRAISIPDHQYPKTTQLIDVAIRDYKHRVDQAKRRIVDDCDITHTLLSILFEHVLTHRRADSKEKIN